VFGGVQAEAAAVAPSNLKYSTYFGGSGNDQGFMVAAAPDGGVYTTGILPDSTGRIKSFVVYYNASAGIGWNRSITGTGDVAAYYIRANSAGLYVVGVTTAPDLPNATNSDAAGTLHTGFITVLDPVSGTILRSTYLGGKGYSAANVDALDPVSGNVYVGMSTSTQTQLMMLDPAGSHVLWSMLLGGSGASTHPYGMQTDPSGNVIVATLTNSTRYPVVNAQQATSGGGYDTGVTKLSPQAVILWSTYLGGSGLDRPNGLDTDPSGNVYVAGRTYSSNFPLKNPYQQTNSDSNAAYVTSYTSSGSMRYSTYIGGNGADWFGGVTVASDGTAWAVGGSGSSDMPVVGGASYLAKRSGYAYIAAVKPDGSGLSYATYLGGSGNDGTSGAILSSQGLWLIGRTTSKDFPIAQPTQSANAGGYDVWVTLLTTT
jgi:hypothetical protein